MRYPAKCFLWLIIQLKVPLNPKIFTTSFGLLGLYIGYSILNKQYQLAAVLIPIKIMLSLACEELEKNHQKEAFLNDYFEGIMSYFFNIIIFICIGIQTNTPIWISVIGIFFFQFQNSIFSYYYILQKNHLSNYENENNYFIKLKQTQLSLFSKLEIFYQSLYYYLYATFEFLIEKIASKKKPHSSFFFMTILSLIGSGFQLTLISLFLFYEKIEWIHPFFIVHYAIFAATILTAQFIIRKINQC